MAERRHTNGFSLIELMIVVAILGILAAIAVPSYLRFQLRARSGEGKTNLAAIRVAEGGYFGEHQTYVAAAAAPAGVPSAAKTPWPAPAPGCPACFDELGFRPEGEVVFQYEVVAANAGGGATLDVFTASAVADLDGDGVLQIWGYVHALETGAGGVPSTLAGGQPAAPCAATGTWDPIANAGNRLDTVGPCEATSGQSVF
jgi:type IV pilus assembly protein PilA